MKDRATTSTAAAEASPETTSRGRLGSFLSDSDAKLLEAMPDTPRSGKALPGTIRAAVSDDTRNSTTRKKSTTMVLQVTQDLSTTSSPPASVSSRDEFSRDSLSSSSSPTHTRSTSVSRSNRASSFNLWNTPDTRAIPILSNNYSALVNLTQLFAPIEKSLHTEYNEFTRFLYEDWMPDILTVLPDDTAGEEGPRAKLQKLLSRRPGLDRLCRKGMSSVDCRVESTVTHKKPAKNPKLDLVKQRLKPKCFNEFIQSLVGKPDPELQNLLERWLREIGIEPTSLDQSVKLTSIIETPQTKVCFGDGQVIKQLDLLDTKSCATFLREVAFLFAFDHKNIIGFKGYELDFSRPDAKVLRIILEHGTGGTLEDRIKEGNFNDKEFIFHTLFGIAQGLKYIHDNDLVYRDLKPANIVFTQRGIWGIAKLIDFGVTGEAQNSRQETSTLRTTKLFSAPEQSSGKDAKEADIFSFGMLMYQVLTGHTPFEGTEHFDDPAEAIAKGIRPQFPANVDGRLTALIEQCWNGNPKLRPTIKDVMEQLFWYFIQAPAVTNIESHIAP